MHDINMEYRREQYDDNPRELNPRHSASIVLFASALIVGVPSCGIESEPTTYPIHVEDEVAFDAVQEERNEPASGETTSNVAAPEQSLIANKGIILLDRTGSMLARRGTGNSRCRDVRAMAIAKVDQFFMQYGGSAVSVWTFNGTSVAKLTGYVNSATAKTAINGLTTEGCTDVTPLADAICKAADELYALRSTASRPNLLTILTDGGENASTGICKGTSNAPTDSTSWRFKARQRIGGYFPYVQVNPMFWTGSLYVTAKGFDPETGGRIPSLPQSAILCSTQDACDHDFFLMLAGDTGGTYELAKDNNTQYPCGYNQCPPPYYDPLAW